MLGRRSNRSWGSSSLDFKKQRNQHVSIYISTTKSAMAKRMTALDSAHSIGLSTALEGVLIVVGTLHRWIFKNSEISMFPFIFPQLRALW